MWSDINWYDSVDHDFGLVKIAKAQAQKIPYMVVLGDKEVEERLVSVRERSEGDLGQWDRAKFIDVIRDAAI